MDAPVDIRPDHLEIVRQVLREHLNPQVKVSVFGSRAVWTTTDASDLDLALEGRGQLDRKTLNSLKSAFESSELPYSVDVVDLNRASLAFKEIVQSQMVPLPKLGNRSDETKDKKTSENLGEQREITLGECAFVVSETVLPTEMGDTPYVGLEHIGENSLALLGRGSAKDVTSTKSRFKEGDVLFGKLRPYFRKVIRAPFDGICSTDIWVIRPETGVDARYLFYLMATQQVVDFATQGSIGTKMPRAKWDHVGRYPVNLPPLPEQRRIAGVLGALDEKIELNRRMNETLEEMARAVFKDWFVDFGPVRAKMEGREAHLPEEVWRLFPDRLVESELGAVPEGWEVKALGDCYELTMGQSPPGNTYNDDGDGVPFFQGRADFGFRYPTNRRYCTVPTRFADADDTLVSVRAPVGDINMAWERCCVGRGLAALRHKSNLRSFTYYSALNMQDQLRDYEDTGTVFGAINKRQFESIAVVEPAFGIVEAFDRQVSSVDDKIRNNVVNSRMNTTTREGLLPELLSGDKSLTSRLLG